MEPRLVAIGALAVLASALGGAVVGGVGLVRLAVLALLVVGATAWALSRPWGSAVVLLPVLFVPSLPAIGPAPESLVAGALVLGLAAGHLVLARPQVPDINWLALAPAVSIGTFALFLTLFQQRDWKQAAALIALSVGGILVGTALAQRQNAARVFAFIAAAIALLAMYETLIGSHIWPLYRSGNRYLLADDPAARRAFTTLGHPLIAGSGLAIMAAIAWSTLTGRLRLPLTAFIVIGSLTTVTRSAAVALLAGMLLAILFARTQRLRSGAVLASIGIAAVVAVAVSPVLQTSLANRVGNSQERQTVRTYSLELAESTLRDEPLASAIGGGIGEGYARLVNRGSIYGLYTYDNQYVTMLLDIGWLPLLALGTWAFFLAWRNRDARPLGVPMLAVPIIVAGFTDVLVWPSMVALSWVLFGIATAPKPQPETG